MKFGKLLLQDIILLLNPSLRLKNRTRMAPGILTNGNQCLMLVTNFGRHLVNTGPADLLHRAPPIRKELLSLMRLDPDLVEMRSQRLPVPLRPFRIGDPDIATCLRKERRIQNLKKDIDLRFLTLRIRIVNLTKLDIVFPEDVRDNSHQKSCILHEPWAAVGNQIDSHYIISGCVL